MVLFDNHFEVYKLIIAHNTQEHTHACMLRVVVSVFEARLFVRLCNHLIAANQRPCRPLMALSTSAHTQTVQQHLRRATEQITTHPPMPRTPQTPARVPADPCPSYAPPHAARCRSCCTRRECRLKRRVHRPPCPYCAVAARATDPQPCAA